MAKTDKTSNIYINGKQAGETLSDLRKKARELSNEMNHLAPGTEEYKKKINELGQVQGKLAAHQNEIKKIGETMSNVSQTFEQRLASLNERINSGTMNARELGKAVKEYQTIALQAGRETPVGQQAIQDAAQLQDKLSDLRNEINRAAHDGANMQAAMQVGSTLIAGYGVAQSVTAALGIENENLQETFVKLQMTTVALNSVEQIRANLEKESFMMQKARTIGTAALTAATAVYTAVVGTATGAMKAFKIALVATGFGAIAVAIGLVVAYFDKLVGWVELGVQKFRDLGNGIKIAIAVMFPIVGIIWGIIAALEYLGVIEGQQEEAARTAAEAIKKRQQEILAARRAQVAEAIKENAKLQKSVGETYDYEIAKAKAAGKDTSDLERQKRAEMRRTYEEALKLHEESMKLNATSFSAQFQGVKKIAEAKAAMAKIDREEELETIRQNTAKEEAAKKAAETARQEFQKLSNDLKALAQAEAEFRKELDDQARLDRLEGEALEMAQAELRIEKKFQAEIEKAKKLAEQKGQIGIEAAERLAHLELLQQEALEAEKAKITEVWTKKNADAEKEARQEAAKDQLLIKDAQLKAEAAATRLELEGIAEWETEKRQEVLNRLREINMRQAEQERDQKLLDLELQFENEAISLEEFHAYKEQLEAEHLERVGQLNKEAAQQNAESLKQSIEGALGAIQQVSNALGAFRDAQHKKEMAQIDAQKNRQIKALDEEKKKGLITEEEYQRKLDSINEDAAQKEAAAKKKQAEADKRAALINAAIQTALAIVKAAPNPALMALAGVVGAIQIAAIASQPIPQFKDGGFNVIGAQDGKSYNAKYIGKHPGGMLPNHPVVLASEAGPEYFVPNPLLSNPEVIDHVRAIENIRLRQFADGGPTTDMPDAPSTPMNANDSNEAVFVAILQQLELNALLMSDLREVLPNLAVVIGDEKVDELRERMEQIEGIRA
jgi:hypothetical protein